MILDPQVLEAALARFEAEYIDPEKAARAAAEIRHAAGAGEYAQLDGAAACAAVTKVFFTVCQDKHLRLIWSEEPEPLEEEDGVRKVEILDGGIGYVDLTLIPTAETGGATIAATMQLVAGTKALILDLRGTIGGSTDGVQLGRASASSRTSRSRRTTRSPPRSSAPGCRSVPMLIVPSSERVESGPPRKERRCRSTCS